MKIKKYIIQICMIFLLCIVFNMEVFAEDAEKITEEVSEELIEEILEDNVCTDEVQGYENCGENSITLFSTDIEYAESIEAAADILRQQMIMRNGLISVYYHGEYVEGMSKPILDAAVAYDDSLPGMAGDYLRYNYNRIVRRVYRGENSSGIYYRFVFEISYLSSYEQELAVEEKVQEILSELNIYDSDRETQIRSIYAYVTGNVKYDNMIYETFNVHSAYAAAIEGKAVCQGYSLLLYRLLQEIGIKNRMVPGDAGGVGHVWNIVEMDGRWYNLDATWDWGTSDNFSWFLKGSESFDNTHRRSSEYLTEAFCQRYVMSEKDYGYVPVKVNGVQLNTNILELDGKGAAGQLTAIINPENADNQKVIWTSSDKDIVTVDSNGGIMAVNAGTAVITVQTEDGGYTAKCTVRILSEAELTYKHIEAFVSRLYKEILGRDADPSGLKAWADVLKSGKEQGAKVAQGFIGSEELKKRNLSDDAYIRALYRTFFDREADGGGLAAWQKVLDSGLSRMHVFRGFAESDEFTKICDSYGIIRGYADLTAPMDQNEGVTKFIVRSYRLCLNREADAGGLNGWCDAILSGKNTAKEAAYGFVFSNEFIKKNLSDREYVKVLYRVFMDREADGGGLSSWEKVLKEGKSREHVFNGFADSAEFRKICQSYGIG